MKAASRSKSNLSSTISLASLAVTLLGVVAVVCWREEQYETQEQQSVLGIRNRLLKDADEVTCEKYLMNFLNGTTDENDQCQAYYNAYKVADCGNETNSVILFDDIAGDDKKNNTEDDDDDVVIDDYFIRLECCDTIVSFYERNCESKSELHSSRLLGIMLVMLVCTMIKAMLKQFNLQWIPDACAFILVGTVVGLMLRLVNKGLLQNRLSFDNDLFLQIMLPPIIFQAALSIDKRSFRRDLFPILAFAGLGTAFSAVAIGLVTHHISKLGNGGNDTLPMLDSLVFGSLISSVDPVATLSILAGVGVSKQDTLYVLIFGEALLNDGVAIVLFDTLKSSLGEDEDLLDPEAYQKMAKHFFAVLFGSIGVGMSVGICSTLYFWLLRGRQTAVTEVAVFFCWALIPYYIADGLGCSGIISIMVMGFYMDYYVIGGFQSEESAWMDYMAMRNPANANNEHAGMMQGTAAIGRWSQLHSSCCHAFNGQGHILSRSRSHVGFVAEVVASLMETAIFAYLGLFLFTDNVWNFRLNLTAILGVVSSRAVMVVILSLIINIFVFFDVEGRISRCFRSCRRINLAEDDESFGSHTRVYLDRKTQLILLLAGVRGAVSFSLVENIPVWDSVTKTGSQYKAELKAMTSSSIVFTLFVFGALTFTAVKRGSDPRDGSHIAGSRLTHRLLSEPLDSDDENQSTNLSSGSAFEIEHDGARQPVVPAPGNQTTNNQYQGPSIPEHQPSQYHQVHNEHWME